ncbi:hypothetical protein ZIOFF_036186 [Zingiber officinale]|uniref:RRM domain-containing protein n=1 Tax=Zingiber officinale TaxID=94328 RepID=A0A8J5L392_ZINOF|nr:hypothetical protein ZIOFF_036186 [Zingiber officinale]
MEKIDGRDATIWTHRSKNPNSFARRYYLYTLQKPFPEEVVFLPEVTASDAKEEEKSCESVWRHQESSGSHQRSSPEAVSSSSNLNPEEFVARNLKRLSHQQRNYQDCPCGRTEPRGKGDDQNLREVFTSFGKVVEAQVIIDKETGWSRGFGFVAFTSSEEASAAISGMDGKDVHGQMIRVNYATDRTGEFRGSGGGYGGSYGSGGYGGGGVASGGGYGGYEQSINFYAIDRLKELQHKVYISTMNTSELNSNCSPQVE